MHLIKILGAQGSRSTNAFTTCIQVTPNTLIDAGNIMHALGEKALHVNRIFFSHAHLDHIIDSAFLIDNFFAKRTEPLYFYGLPETLQALKTHLFNHEIWPDFSQIHLLGSASPAIVYVEIVPEQPYEIEEGITLTPIMSNHTVACCGYAIEKEGSGILFSGDTYQNPHLWTYLNSHPALKALIIDVSFPNRFAKIALESKHLTPALLHEELHRLKRTDIQIYTNHLKPFYASVVMEELHAIGITHDQILQDGDAIDLASGRIERDTSPSSHDIIAKLTAIGTALSAESNLDVLLEMIVAEAKHLTHADGGTLYLVDEQNLRFKVAQTDSLNIKMGGTHGAITWPQLPLYLEDGTPNKKMVAATCVLEDRLINIPDVYEAEGFSFEGTKAFDKNTGYRSKSMLVIPLKNHEDEIIGVLQLINKIDPDTTQNIPFEPKDASISLSLASQAAVAITNKSLIQGLENLLEAFLKSIIFAISKKSPYTAGHIKRMVKLSTMLTEAIHHDNTHYREKHFTPDEFKQINFAALMHDIGKLATPEQIIDKATKLEAIFDRIALVESRVEVLKKALHVKFLEDTIAILKGESHHAIPALEEAFNTQISLIDDALILIQTSNKGAEFLSQCHASAIQAIAQESWHIHGKDYFILTPDEAYHLGTQKGTLTTEEREIINDHAKLSVDILNKLPFPKKYKAIPQISGNHHEKLNGKGYPQGLRGDEISFEARILAIADIFEALTASDRPYKPGMTLSTAMKILYFMAKEGDLDKEMVKFFYQSEVYLKYAEAFLPERSIDEVTVDFNTL